MKNAPRRPGTAAAYAICVAAIILLLALLYARVRSFAYVDYDDIFYIRDNAAVRAGLSLAGVQWAFTTFYVANWHPLTWLSHMLDVSLFGLDLGAHHLMSVALHGVVSLLVFAFGCAWLQRRDSAFVMALMFLVHPQHVESVAWLAERKDLLCAIFFLLATLAYRHYVLRPGSTRYALVMLAFAGALASKPMAVSLPVILLLLDVWPLGRVDTAAPVAPQLLRLLIEKLPLALMSLAACVVTVLAQHSWYAVISLDDATVWHRFANSTVSYALYLRDFVLPGRLSPFYPFNPRSLFGEVIPALLALAAVAGVCVRLRHKHPALAVGLLWFVVTLLPVIGLVQVGSQARADRYMYIPSIGLLLAIGASLPRPGHAAYRKVMALTALIGMFWSALCYMQIGYWESPLTMFSRAAAVTEDNVFAETRIIDLLTKSNALGEADSKATALLRRHPERHEVYMGLGKVRLAQQEWDEAETLFLAALEVKPDHVPAMNMLGVTLYRKGRTEEACNWFRRAMEVDPQTALVNATLINEAGCDLTTGRR